MKNEKAFTLVELMVTIAIFGMIMLASIPNVVSMVDKNKRVSYVNDAKKLVKLARYRFYTDYQETKPNQYSCVKYSINNLDMSDLQTPPNSGTYDNGYSFVKIRYDGYNYYNFYVQLVERYTANGSTYYRGVKYTDSSNLYLENAKLRTVSTPQNSLTGFTSYSGGC